MPFCPPAPAESRTSRPGDGVGREWQLRGIVRERAVQFSVSFTLQPRFFSMKRWPLLCLLIISTLVVVILVALQCIEPENVHMGRLVCQYWRRARRCYSFQEWAACVNCDSNVQCCDEEDVAGIPTPTKPHFILSNHTTRYRHLSSMFAVAHVAQRPTRVVVHTDYPTPIIGSIINTIVHDHEIRIDASWSRDERHRQMTAQCRQALNDGYNVLLLLDDMNVPSKPIRAFV